MPFNFADLFEQVADVAGDREALVCGDRHLTYAELDERSTRLANHLVGLGVRPGSHVGIYAYNCPEWIETWLACFKARASGINVNFRYVTDELRYVFENSDMVALVHGPEFDDPPYDGPTLRIGEDYEKALAAASPDRSFGPRSGDDPYVIYTGGTTGMPKGVVWRSEDAFYATMGGGNYAGPPVESEQELVDKARDAGRFAHLITPPLMHAAGQWVAMSAFFAGMTVVLLDGKRFDPHHAWELVEREKVGSLVIVGDAMGRPLAEAIAEDPSRYDTSSLFVVGSGGAALSPAVKEQLASALPNAMVLDSFGSSESGYQGRAAEARKFTVSDTTAVFDDELRRVEPGSAVVGRLAQTGHIPVGYYNDPEKTAATFMEVAGQRWAFAGDMATVESDGTINLLGRGSACVNTGGEKVYPEEVEDVLKAHPAVFDALVVGIPDERWGERVAAIVQTRTGDPLSLEDLQEHCRTKLAGYKVPRQVHLVARTPRQPSGKPDYPAAKRVAMGEG
ncbi:MAG: 3-oxocholest-4-en-26-oate---CoA ligase [Actinomycetota bacterium]